MEVLKYKGFKTIPFAYPEQPDTAQMQQTLETLSKSLGTTIKAAEDIRNNPDISVWQQDRRLRELDDLQNYAPLLYGLSLKDLINYRSQLADKVNYWTTQYNNIFDKAMGLVDTSTPAERLERSAQFSTKALEQLQGLV